MNTKRKITSVFVSAINNKSKKKNAKQIPFLVIFIATLIFSACKRTISQEDLTCCDINIDNLDIDAVSFEDLFCDIRLIPLENHSDAMLSSVSKMMVTKDGYVLLDENQHSSSVCLFSHEGEYRGQVGDIGHGHGEYEYIFDVSADEEKKIVLSTLHKFMVYNAKGKFLHDYETPRNSYMRNILCYKDGIVCTSNYSGSEFLLHFFDNSSKLKKELLPSYNNQIGNPPRIKNLLQMEGNLLCYCDPYASELNIIDIKKMLPRKKYRLQSEHMMTIDKAKKESKRLDIGNVDVILSYYIDNGKIICNVHSHDYEVITIEIDVETDKYTMRRQNGWLPMIYDNHDGYDYTVISQTEFLDIINPPSMDDMARWAMAPKLSEEAKKMFKEAYANLGKEITEDNNFVILKLKKK